MEIINASSRKLGIRGRATISFNKKEIYFSAQAKKDFGLIKGKRINFVTDIDRLYFFVTDDPDGIQLFDSGYGIKIYPKLLTNVLKEKIPNLLKSDHVFPIRMTPTKLNDCELIEVLFHKKS